ncbi:MAG: HNH endonuclease [Burkholderiaceae bacterium]
MSVIEELKPKRRARVIDLVAAAGHDVSDWKNFKGGIRKEASNPKYCYEWAFTQAGKAVVLSLWHEELQDVAGEVVQRLNYRQHAATLQKTAARATWVKRAETMDAALALAYTQALPVRVIVCDGNRSDRRIDPEKASTVSRRMLDPIPWAVISYDPASGACTVMRKKAPRLVEDQFSGAVNEDGLPIRRPSASYPFVRDGQVSQRVRERAKGFCEYCSQAGFTKPSGAIYIETHHIVALCEHGEDRESNVIALCPNDHRRAHYGVDAPALRAAFERIVAAKLKLVR